MDPSSWGASIDPVSSALSFAGGMYAQNKTDERQEKAQAFNAQQAANQMRFQEEMSSSAYQRGMSDMKKAGLNPILAYQKGPASSPTGAAAATTFSAANDVITPALHSGQQASRVSEELKNMVATNENLRTQNKLLGAQVLQVGSQIANINANTANQMEMLNRLRKESAQSAPAEWYRDSKVGWGLGVAKEFMSDIFGLTPMGGKSGGVSVRPFLGR